MGAARQQPRSRQSKLLPHPLNDLWWLAPAARHPDTHLRGVSQIEIARKPLRAFLHRLSPAAARQEELRPLSPPKQFQGSTLTGHGVGGAAASSAAAATLPSPRTRAGQRAEGRRPVERRLHPRRRRGAAGEQVAAGAGLERPHKAAGTTALHATRTAPAVAGLRAPRPHRAATNHPSPFLPQVPRLVARIAELEEQLYSSEAGDASLGEAGGLLDRFGGLLKKAQQGLDAGIAYV